LSTNDIVALPNIYESLAILIGLGSVSVALNSLDAFNAPLAVEKLDKSQSIFIIFLRRS
jgi:hypothetical protein